MDVAVASLSLHRRNEDFLAGLLPGPGPQTEIQYRLDPGEHARRQAAGITSVRDLSALDALLTLPENVEIDRNSVSGRVQRIVSRLPPSAVAQRTECLERLLRPAVSIERVTVALGRSWSVALRRVLEFSQYAQRVVHCRSTPADDDVLEASYHGVGLTTSQDGVDLWLLAPEPFLVLQHSAARWAFAEQIYDLHLSQIQESAPASLAT